MRNIECCECRYWDPIYDDGDESREDCSSGFCRRHAPSVIGHNNKGFIIEQMHTWPMTSFTEWCGESNPAQNSHKPE